MFSGAIHVGFRDQGFGFRVTSLRPQYTSPEAQRLSYT